MVPGTLTLPLPTTTFPGIVVGVARMVNINRNEYVAVENWPTDEQTGGGGGGVRSNSAVGVSL